MFRRRFLTVLPLMILVLLASSSPSRGGDLAGAFSPAVEALFEKTDPRPAIHGARVIDGWKKDSCTTATWTLVGTDPTGRLPSLDIDLRMARPTRPAPGAPTVLLLPPTGGGTFLDERMLQVMCEEGIRVFLIRHWSGDLETDLDPATHDRGSLRGVAAIRQTMSFFRVERAGIYGTSLGGILASIAAGIDDRINATVLTVAGGNVIETLAWSDQSLLADLRARRKKAYCLSSDDEYEEFLRRAITINASEFTRPELHDSMWMLVALDDTTVPTHVQEELWNLWGRPQRTDFHLSHLPTAVWVELTYARDIARFFAQALR